jgi:Flp pilus assembly protein TadD
MGTLRNLALGCAALLVFAGCGRLAPEKALSQAAAAALDGNWHLALDESASCLRGDEKNVEAMVLKGISLHELHRSDEALEILEKAADLAPQQHAVHFLLGWVLSENKKYGDALQPLRHALELKPDHADTLILLSRCTLEQNLPEGIEYLETLKRSPGFRQKSALYNSQAYIWLNQGHYETARKLLLEAWRLDQRNPIILQNLAVLHDQYLQDPAKAMRFYRYCLSACQQTGDVGRQAGILQRLRSLSRENRNR